MQAAEVIREAIPASRSSQLPPGPRTPALIQSLRYALNPYEAIRRSMQEWPTPVTVKAFGQGTMVVFTEPDAIKEIFTDDGEVLRSGEAVAPLLGPILGLHSILVLDGARHFRERRLMGPPFHGERMHVYGRLMQQIAARTVDRWSVGSSFPLHKEMQSITLDVILRAVFGVDEGAVFTRLREHLEPFLALADSPAAAFLSLAPFQINLGRLSPWGRFLRDRATVHAILLDEIARRRREGTTGRTDILSLLVDARDEQGAPMRDAELLDEMFTLLMAGHETTATSLAWFFFNVLPRRDVLEKLRDELERVVGGGPVVSEHVPRLEYLEAVMKESARVTPVATNVVRRVHAPVRIGGIDLPAGISVSASIYGTHHRADLWPDPDRFDPDRFLGTRPSPNTYFPFGGGVRRCIGAAFATYELKIVLGEVLSRTVLRIAPGYRMRPVLRAVTIAPSRGMPVVMERRLR